MKRGEIFVLLLVMALAFGASQWLRGSRAPGSDAQGAALARLTAQQPLQMISSTTCRYCTQAREWMQAQGVRFEECFIEREEACRQRFLATGALATPTFVVGRSAVLGLDAPRLIELLQSAQPQQAPAASEPQ